MLRIHGNILKMQRKNAVERGRWARKGMNEMTRQGYKNPASSADAGSHRQGL